MLCSCSLFLHNGKENAHILPKRKIKILAPRTVTDKRMVSGSELPTTMHSVFWWPTLHALCSSNGQETGMWLRVCALVYSQPAKLYVFCLDPNLVSCTLTIHSVHCVVCTSANWGKKQTHLVDLCYTLLILRLSYRALTMQPRSYPG